MMNFEATSFRANPAYKLVSFDRLPDQEKDLFAELRKDPDFYGILYPTTTSTLSVKSVCRNSALLFFTLQEPGKLPSYIKTLYREEVSNAIAQLILDGILEIEVGDRFVSGRDAYEFIQPIPSVTAAEGKIAQLSVAALKYAQELPITDATQLSLRLYFFNRSPVSVYWKRKLPTPDAILNYLGIQPGRSVATTLDHGWRRVSLPTSNSSWIAWHRRRHLDGSRPHTLRYKLYLSPPCEWIPHTFQTLIDISTTIDVPSFKIGNDVYGLLRPDKLVVYFESFEQLEAASELLRQRLTGVPAQGVPFTAEIGGDGLLSWGIDPPKHEQSFGWSAHESWRLWVTNRLATALLTAKMGQAPSVEPWQFAMQRLRYEGIDPYSWTPERSMWRDDVITEG